MFAALALSLVPILAGTLLTYLYDRNAPFAARLATGACTGYALFATVGFLLALLLGLQPLTLVLTEVALAFILLSGAALLIRSFYQLQQVNPGFETTNVITMWLPMTAEQYPGGPQIVSYLGQVMEKIEAVPGVRNAATTTALAPTVTP